MAVEENVELEGGSPLILSTGTAMVSGEADPKCRITLPPLEGGMSEILYGAISIRLDVS